MANSQHEPRSHPADPLAAAVLHTLVTEARDGVSLSQMAVKCERNPADPAELGEIETALKILLDDGLAERDEELFRPTHAAIRAAELSF